MNDLGRRKQRWKCPFAAAAITLLLLYPHSSGFAFPSSDIPQEQGNARHEDTASKEQSHPPAQTESSPSSKADKDKLDGGDIQLNQIKPAASEPQKKVSVAPEWVRLVMSIVFSWPFVIYLLLMYLLFYGGAAEKIEELLGPFQSLTLFGTKLELNQQSGRTVEAAVALYRRRVQRKFDHWVKKEGLEKKHQEVITRYLAPRFKKFSDLDIRSTIYVQDVLFEETIYQLLEYYPPSPGPTRRGRTYSVRFGMIGKAWRLCQSQVAGAVPTTEDRLILDWGMTREEAREAGHSRQSFGCVVIKNTVGDPLGLFYLDSPGRDAFGDGVRWKELEDAILTGCKETELQTGLETICREFVAGSPRVYIYSKYTAHR